MRLTHYYIYLIVLLLSFENLYADGSKDFYPMGVQGNRAYLLSRPPEHNEFSNYGRHFVYAKVGETVAVASSAQGVQNGKTIVYSPSGKMYVNNDNFVGKIIGQNGFSNRQAELAGPRDGYQAYELLVDEEGIWKVEFISPNGDVYRNADVLNIYANDNWQQRENENLIAAWDVSIRNRENTAWMEGRVYANVINLHISSAAISSLDRGFHGRNFVLTKDGYIYKVDGNGSVGLRFTYFVNNAGFLDALGNPSYKSSNNGYFVNIADPNQFDTERYITHKMFYQFPSEDLPSSAKNAGYIDWLKNKIEIAEVKNIKFNGSEGLPKYVNTKGVSISFETNFAGRYKATIKSKSNLITFVQKDIIITATRGLNEFKWDGTDGQGKFVPIGQYDIEVGIASIEGEIHFPYFDMEINPNGILIERLNPNGSSAGPAIAYWDDSELTEGMNSESSKPLTNLLGISSFENGHRWGTYSGTTGAGNAGRGAYSFGNDKAIDTWSYSVQIEEKSTENIIVNVSDLEVVSISANKQSIELNEELQYSVIIKNNGPSDAVGATFEYQLPLGFTIRNVRFNSDCGKMYNLQYSGNQFNSKVDLSNGCEAIIVISAIANNVPDASYGLILAEAGVVRPRGYTDPDATNTGLNNNFPGNSKEECISNCNNIKLDQSVFLLEPYNERGAIALIKNVKHIDANSSGFQELGEELEYTFTLKNTGQVELKNIALLDSLISQSSISFGNIILNPGEEYSLTRRYTLKASDISKKVVHNKAFVNAKNPRNFDVNDISGHTYFDDKITSIDIDQKPNIYLKKEVVNSGTGENQQFTLGDKIDYKFTIKHVGDVGVHQLKLIDTLFIAKEFPINGISFNNIIEYKLSYTITEKDIANKEVVNTAEIIAYDTKYGTKLTDKSGHTFEDDNKTVVLTAKPYNTLEDNFEMYQGNIAYFDVLRNDVRGSSSIPSNAIVIIKSPEKGKLQIQNNQVVYTPIDNHVFGEDNFSYIINDNSRLSSNESEVHVNIIKTKPIAVEDYYYINYNSNTTIDPLENDYVAHSKIKSNSLRIISYPTNGIIEFINGKLKYTPNKTFSGIDEFQYIISDENDNWSEPAIVKLETTGFFIPNVVTPNGDGLNDSFEIIGLYMFDKTELQIFDRFGNSVYQSSNYQNDWNIDSTIAEGTYYYIFKGSNSVSKPLVRKGSFLINRTKLN